VSAEIKRARFAQFVSHEWKRLVSFVRSWLSDSGDLDAEDIVQDVLTGIFERADVTAPIADLSAYVYGALRNRVIDAYRRRRPSPSLEGEWDDGERESLQEVLSDLRYEASVEAEKERIWGDVFAAIDGLPPDQQAVFTATELEGRSFRELSEEWEVPIGTLLSRKHRAVVSLRAALAAYQRS
jgi:RNA polymerase sigma factor (sigma-70 family)